MTLAPGARLGPYEVLALLGSGGMGEVYRAKDTRLDRLVDSTRSNIWTMPLDGGPPRQLTHFTDLGTVITDFKWSRDGQRLAIGRSTTTNDIVLFKGLRP